MDKIALAFVKAQKAFGPALKTNTNPHFKSKYADLSACVEAVIDALNANGIALVQKTHPSDTGVSVETVLLHESGESLSSGILHVPASKQDPQGYGSALTYARRYSLMAACGIAPEDDDGNAASKAETKTETKTRLPKLTPSEAAKEYAKWEAEKKSVTDSDGILDDGKAKALWFQKPSNVRSAVKDYSDSLKSVEELDRQSSEHMRAIAA